MVTVRRGLWLFLCTLAPMALACNIPVFRYALERWQSDTYEIVVYNATELSAADSDFVKHLRASSRAEGGNCNFSLSLIDDTAVDDSAAGLPELVMKTEARGRSIELWRGPIDKARQANLLDSPARKELGKRLLTGDAIVWLVVGSKGSGQFSETRERLKLAFERLERRIKLPEGIGLPGSELHSEVPLLVKFSSIEIDLNDQDELFLVQLLSGLRPEAVQREVPLLVPVFGRGRALEVIPADECSDSLIDDLTQFLSGACSCQVKEQNPGFDLLLAIDWDDEIFGDRSGPRPPSLKAPEPDQPAVLLTIPPGKRR